jgi:hypothetical protein
MPIYLLSPRTILVVEVTIKLKNMIDDKKIETVANEYSQDNCGYSYNINKLLAFKAGAKWAIIY